MEYIKRMFAGEYDGGEYCDFSSANAQATFGGDILLGIWDSTGATLLAVAGQQGLTINRSADTIEVTTKTTGNAWRGYVAGTKEWSIDLDGVYVMDDASVTALENYFESGDLVCVKVYNKVQSAGLFGGLAVLTDFTLEAPNDDAMTYSISLSGVGKLHKLSGTT